jgi:hypothetical protein
MGGKKPRGKRPPAFTPEEAKEIRESYFDPKHRETTYTLARLYRVSPVTINNAVMRRGAYKET